MTLHLVATDYRGMAGVLQVRNLQHDLSVTLKNADWVKVRHLDRACGVLINNVIAANQDSRAFNGGATFNKGSETFNKDNEALILALSELKDVYADLIIQCRQEVGTMAR